MEGLDVKEGQRVRVHSGEKVYEGLVMPSPKDTVVVKLDSGYNIGIPAEEVSKVVPVPIEEIPQKVAPPTTPIVTSKELPRVSIISTGGTIASRVDYRTGAVTSQFDAEDILGEIPELANLATYNAHLAYNILSENMLPEYWQKLAEEVYSQIEGGTEGVVITHGTDTMGYTAAALSFMLSSPVPIVLVGSQRSSDRPSSDAAMNALCAVKVALSDIAEVSVVMHKESSDTSCLAHRGCKVRKMHTSRRDAFKSINAPPLAVIHYPSLKLEKLDEHRRRGEVKLDIHNNLDEKCCIIKYTPGASSDIIDYYVDKGYRGIVLEGTGLGHVGRHWLGAIKRAVDEGVIVVVTSQCLYGRVCDRVYDTGRDMLKAGIIEGEDMLPEVALVKLMWLLANYPPEEAKKLVKENLVGEINRRISHDYYP
ncbi:MAG: Glu-tRNA(Gln) amidotransferase GatDE subunit D [Deltaproteobacteria bacterium]|nr:MAG: Glu-tRNA(Gln) amidotransferase GatDE subunit D [Deltaproteobacteria bacterium]